MSNLESPLKEFTTNAANVFAWEGTPSEGHPRLLFTVCVDPQTGAATRKGGGALEPTILDTRTMVRISVTDGVAYVEALPFHYRNAPYCWAEAVVFPQPDGS